MRTWMTEFQAICAKTGELKIYGGPNLVRLTWDSAQKWCYENAGHLVVVGQLLMEIPAKRREDGAWYPDWDEAVDYDAEYWN
ncbi:MAG: hypothetical protein ACI9N1_000363 [Flavobacteriales bacterium]|jgi:hypothetical protein